MVWSAASINQVLGPYVFENQNVTGSVSKRMQGYFLFPILEGYTEDMIFQMDGGAPLYSLDVREYLDRKLPNRWVERGGLSEWAYYLQILLVATNYYWVISKLKYTENLFEQWPNSRRRFVKQFRLQIKRY